MLMLGERTESQRNGSQVVAVNVVPDSWAEQSPSCWEHCSLYGPTLSGHQPAEPWFFSGPSSNASQFLRPRFSPEKEAQLVFSFFSWHLISCSILWRGLLWLSAVSTFFFTEYEWEVKWKHHNRMIKVPRKRREKLTKKTPVFVISLYKILFWFRRFYLIQSVQWTVLLPDPVLTEASTPALSSLSALFASQCILLQAGLPFA